MAVTEIGYMKGSRMISYSGLIPIRMEKGRKRYIMRKIVWNFLQIHLRFRWMQITMKK